MRFWAMAFSRVVFTCSWLTTSRNVCGRYLRAMTWYMRWVNARPRVIRGTRTAPLPLLPSGPGGVCSRPLHGARDLTSIYRSTQVRQRRFWKSEVGAQRRRGLRIGDFVSLFRSLFFADAVAP